MSGNDSTVTGACNCGAFSLTIPQQTGMALCHCISCRKSGGSVSSANFSINPKDMKCDGPEPSKYVAKGSSGNDVTRAFCGTCGSNLWTAVADPNLIFVKAGLFPPGSVPSPNTHLFAKNMEDWEIVHEGAERIETQ
ncbi:hypothetical protein I317_03615 [Kwoniella heveanensis CBS 569]|nr:hypothetical protein I317_03615 [Kwoniella heveanensis CBS 569]